MGDVNLLFSSAGRRVELIQCFRKAAELLNLEATVIAIDMEPAWSPACAIADYAYKVPACTKPDFIGEVGAICNRHQVDLVIPTIDTELLVYAESKGALAQYGAETLVSSPSFVRIARDKEATARVLATHGVPTPATWSVRRILDGSCEADFPLLAKPKGGSCSKGIVVARSLEDLASLGGDRDSYVAQEYCTGREFTVNCFYDRNGKCRASVPHFRKLVRDGEVCFAQTERVEGFTIIARRFSEIFEGLWGCLCFQGFMADNRDLKVFEINARFGGGYPICDYAGGAFARWILEDLSGRAPDYRDDWREGVRMLRYDAAIFTEV